MILLRQSEAIEALCFASVYGKFFCNIFKRLHDDQKKKQVDVEDKKMKA